MSGRLEREGGEGERERKGGREGGREKEKEDINSCREGGSAAGGQRLGSVDNVRITRAHVQTQRETKDTLHCGKKAPSADPLKLSSSFRRKTSFCNRPNTPCVLVRCSCLQCACACVRLFQGKSMLNSVFVYFCKISPASLHKTLLRGW